MSMPSENHQAAVGGMGSTAGSGGELADRSGQAGFQTGTVTTTSGSATTEPDRNAAGFETPR